MSVLVLLLAIITSLSLCSGQNSTSTQPEITSSPSKVATQTSAPSTSLSDSCPTVTMLSPTETALMENDDVKTLLSIPQEYLPIIVIALFFATVILCFTSLILSMGICIVCCRAHNRYTAPNITSPMMQSDDKLWKPISKPLTENDDRKSMDDTIEITMDTFRKDHAIVTPAHNITTPLIKRNSNQGSVHENEITLPLHAKPYPTPSPNVKCEGLPSTFASQSTGNNIAYRQHSLNETSAIKTNAFVEKHSETSLTKSTSNDSMYMKMESSSAVLPGKPYLPDAESLDSVSYVDYILPTETENVQEDDYENASALRLANALKNKSILPPVPIQSHPTAEKKDRPPEPKPKPNKNKPRKMNSVGQINPVLLPAAEEEPHYMSPRSAGLTSDGYKVIEYKTRDTNDYTVPITHGNSPHQPTY